MPHVPRTPRAVEQRRALGRRVRAHRLALGLTSRDVSAHIGAGKGQMTCVETARQDVNVGTLIDVAGAVGLEVALVAEHHLPLLDLTADEVDALVRAAWSWADAIRDDEDDHIDPALRSALDKLTGSTHA